MILSLSLSLYIYIYIYIYIYSLPQSRSSVPMLMIPLVIALKEILFVSLFLSSSSLLTYTSAFMLKRHLMGNQHTVS
ncbi:hypothetical protein BCR42DRAFT_45868 [Absidia repens]|uniref:Uncharacterized protein n=1 Tax=Absidia repens TaxID=90262 RepID=A0A1X2IEL9_9FUNG|nr:hypothetical protein BCR42DRAFT_45868 [Absidia repens]